MALVENSKSDARRTNETTSLLAVDTEEENEILSRDSYGCGEYSDDDLERSDGSENSRDIRRVLQDEENGTKENEILPVWTIGCILSSSFAYGCIMTTLFLITLPIECERIEKQNPAIAKSVALGCFVALSGFTQLISPLVGMLSDTYRPPKHFQLGQRMPFLSLGAIISVFGLLGLYVESYHRLWIPYAAFFFFHMIGLNITYAMMIALIPDQVPHAQTGIANGILAFFLVTGSLTGFGFFNFYSNGTIQDMYGLYICIVILTTILTGLYAHDRDVAIFMERLEISRNRRDILMRANSLAGKTNKELTKSQRRRRRRRLILGPFVLLKNMLYDPLLLLDRAALIATFSINIDENYDFFVVTGSRLFYYCGSSVQTFFLYFLHDIIGVRDDPESAVAALAVITQISGALVCYPVGWFSDQFCGGRRKPFVYIACILLSGITSAMIFAKTLDTMTTLCFCLGAANGAYLTMETSLAIDTLPKNYDDGPSGGNAQLLGIWGVAAFLGSAIGPMIGGPLLYLFGSSGTVDGQDYTIQGYTIILSLSAAYFTLSAICLTWLNKTGV